MLNLDSKINTHSPIRDCRLPAFELKSFELTEASDVKSHQDDKRVLAEISDVEFVHKHIIIKII